MPIATPVARARRTRIACTRAMIRWRRSPMTNPTFRRALCCAALAASAHAHAQDPGCGVLQGASGNTLSLREGERADLIQGGTPCMARCMCMPTARCIACTGNRTGAPSNMCWRMRERTACGWFRRRRAERKWTRDRARCRRSRCSRVPRCEADRCNADYFASTLPIASATVCTLLSFRPATHMRPERRIYTPNSSFRRSACSATSPVYVNMPRCFR